MKIERIVLVPVLAGLLVAGGGAAWYVYLHALSSNRNSGTVSEQETAVLVAKVGKLTLLPTGETPTVATVSNPASLQNQSFFANAKAGDKVLVYSIAKKAYLYDPVQNIIVNVAPLTIEATTSPVRK